MVAITRYQHKSALQSVVLGNPLVLTNIFQHLEAKDGLNLSITNSSFTKEEPFRDTLNIFINEKKLQYCIETEKKLDSEFCTNTHFILNVFFTCKDSGGSNDELKIIMQSFFDYINENKWFLENNSDFKDGIEDKLIQHLNSVYFHHESLFYLDEIFGIYVNVEEGNDEETLEFIITTNGDKIYF